MTTLGKVMVGLCALIAAGYAGTATLTNARPTPVSVIADRFVFAADIPAAVSQAVDLTAAPRDAAAALSAVMLAADLSAKKSDRVPMSTEATPPRPARYLTVSRRTGPSSSEIVRVPVTDVASR